MAARSSLSYRTAQFKSRGSKLPQTAPRDASSNPRYIPSAYGQLITISISHRSARSAAARWNADKSSHHSAPLLPVRRELYWFGFEAVRRSILRKGVSLPAYEY